VPTWTGIRKIANSQSNNACVRELDYGVSEQSAACSSGLDSSNRFARRCDGDSHLRFAVRRTQKRHLKLRGQQPDALVQHGAMKPSKGGGLVAVGQMV